MGLFRIKKLVLISTMEALTALSLSHALRSSLVPCSGAKHVPISALILGNKLNHVSHLFGVTVRLVGCFVDSND